MKFIFLEANIFWLILVAICVPIFILSYLKNRWVLGILTALPIGFFAVLLLTKIWIVWYFFLFFLIPWFLSGIRDKNWGVITLAGLPIGLFFLVVCNVVYLNHMSTSPRWVFHEVFNKYPSDKINILESDYQFVFDSTKAVLKFKTNDLKEILSMLPELTPISQAKFEDYDLASLPNWCKPLENLPCLFYLAQPANERILGPRILLSYHSESGIAFLVYDIIF